MLKKRANNRLGALLRQMRNQWTPKGIRRYLVHQGVGTPGEVRDELQGLAQSDPKALKDALRDEVLTHLDALRARLQADYPDASDAWIATMVACELGRMVEEQLRDQERYAGRQPSRAEAEASVASWAASPV